MTKSQLEWGQVKFYKTSIKRGSDKKIKTSIQESRVFQIALKGGRNTNFDKGNSTIQCFFDTEADLCVHKG